MADRADDLRGRMTDAREQLRDRNAERIGRALATAASARDDSLEEEPDEEDVEEAAPEEGGAGDGEERPGGASGPAGGL
jgi:hypothetical protein